MEPNRPAEPETNQPIQPVLPFRVGLATRCTLNGVPSTPNMACPREQVTGAAATWPGGIIWRDAVLKPRNRVALGYWDDKKLWGMVSARRRSGRRSWEIDRLYLYGSWPSLDYQDYGSFSDRWDIGWYEDFSAEDAGLELLEQLNAAVGQRSAERVLLRLPSDSPAVPLARRSGFTNGFAETLLEGYGQQAAASGGILPPREGPPGMRPATEQDEYGLFQLYCASAPARVREVVGLTFDQWRESREPRGSLFRPAGYREWVADGPDRLVAWLGISRKWVTVDVQLMTHPDHPQRLHPALDYALAQPGIQRWLTPDYQEGLAERLRNRGFNQVAQYIMMVKPVAVPVRDYGMAPVEA